MKLGTVFTTLVLTQLIASQSSSVLSSNKTLDARPEVPTSTQPVLTEAPAPSPPPPTPPPPTTTDPKPPNTTSEIPPALPTTTATSAVVIPPAPSPDPVVVTTVPDRPPEPATTINPVQTTVNEPQTLILTTRSRIQRPLSTATSQSLTSATATQFTSATAATTENSNPDSNNISSGGQESQDYVDEIMARGKGLWALLPVSLLGIMGTAYAMYQGGAF
ncbi:hypothetical protein BDR26DRAFT_199034 [Obelidium mucronatum]|nr:hypothetical protein BDR26DRAFT_199034 [Obelidium mucronatum]